ncbi:two-component regulator propeller domain-containing protein [Roseateles sp.]|uniref:sensor histidine kinase n=1 Tax=Roseateles sp. TaxID=1971397 RepID=UPI0031D5BF92
MRLTRFTRLPAVCLAALLTAGALAPDRVLAQATTPSTQPLAQLQHSSWTLKDGMPGPVMAIAQTTDGYLWLGTGTGLYRFDGVRFERFDTLAGEHLPSRQVMSLHATRDNRLWVGLLEGGVALVKQGHIEHLEPKSPPGGLFSVSTRSIAETRDGTIWLATGRALLRREGDRWVRIGPESGYGTGSQPPPTINLQIDGGDNVWVCTDQTLYVRPAGSTRFVQALGDLGLGMRQLAIDHEGRAWASGASGSDRRFVRLALPGQTDEGPSVRTPMSMFMPAFDREGKLWFGGNRGLLRTRAAGDSSPSRNPPVDGDWDLLLRDSGLTGDLVMRVFQDRDGAIWVGTNGGLDRFRGAAVERVALPDLDTGATMATSATGELWIAARNIVYRRPAEGGSLVPVPVRGQMETFTAIFIDSRQRRWMAGRNGPWRQEGDRFVQLPSPDGVPWHAAAFEFTEAADGAIWFNANRYGLLRYADGKTEWMSGRQGFPQGGADAIGADARKRLWFGYGDGSLRRLDGEKLSVITPADGLQIGGIKVITGHGEHLWIGGENGVQLVSQAGMPVLRLSDPDALEGVSGLIETPEGDLWLNGARGITHLTANEVRRALADPAYRPHGRRIDLLDGLTGRAEQSWPLRTALRTPDGLLWFALNNGLVTIDPAKLVGDEITPPPVDIQRVIVKGVPMPLPAAQPAMLAAGTRDLEIEYTAMSLSLPERTRFRYRLEGQDADWIDAGSRRRAFYTNLGPGRYEFRVEASIDGGPWSATPATRRLHIEPTLTQSTWFRVLAGLGGVLVLLGAGLLRARQNATRRRERLAARVQERERIARDLHDTLLQGVYGLILRFEAVARRLPADERVAMERVLVDADALLVEGRDRVADLRLPPPDTGRLEQTLDALGTQLAQTHGAAFALAVEGTPRALAPALSASLCLIAREAIFNAFQHAQADRIEVTVKYGADSFSLFIRDDGIGVPDDVQERGGRPGHWGLSGMRERAELAGAEYRLSSRPGLGTQVELCVSADRAYERGVAQPGRKRWGLPWGQERT